MTLGGPAAQTPNMLYTSVTWPSQKILSFSVCSLGCKVALDLKQIMSFGAIFRRENNLGVPNNLSIRPNYMKFEVLVLYIINRDKSRTRKNFWGEKMTDVNK